jgi:hypothetical protein
MTVTNPGDPSPHETLRDVLPLVLVDAEDPDPVQPGRIPVGEVSAGCQGQLVGLVPADPQCPGAGFHAHAVDGHALEDPAGHPVGHRLSILSCLRDRGPEDGDRTIVVAADQPRGPDVQEAWVSSDGKVREPALDVVTDPAGIPAARAVGVDGHRVAVQVGDVSGVGGIVDRQAQLGSPADRVSDEVRGRGRRDGRVRHGSWSGWMVIRHLHPVTAGSFYISGPSPYMLW